VHLLTANNTQYVFFQNTKNIYHLSCRPTYSQLSLTNANVDRLYVNNTGALF